MVSLIFYPGWLNRVNAELDRLSGGLFSAEDFDYPWIEKFMAEVAAENAATLAMTSASLAEARPPAVVTSLAGTQLRAESPRRGMNGGGDSSCV